MPSPKHYKIVFDDKKVGTVWSQTAKAALLMWIRRHPEHKGAKAVEI